MFFDLLIRKYESIFSNFIFFKLNGYYRCYRASGEMVCPYCGLKYIEHKMDEKILSFDGYKFLHVLCNNDRVKL